MSAAERTTCACGGCASCAAAAPRPAVADPLVYRHAALKARLLARIGSTQIEGGRPLSDLGTRDDDDPTIALLDAFAGALHILAWNAGRLSDDGSIRRTEDRDALVDLARLIGYEPRPALSATTTLAFTLDTFKGSPTTAAIPMGTKVASVPGQDEKPQTFETDAELEARVEWNSLLPVQQKSNQTINASTKIITIEGTTTTAMPGDLVVVYLAPQQPQQSWLLATIAEVERDTGFDADAPADPDAARTPPQTRITLASPMVLPAIAWPQGPDFVNQVVILGQRAVAFGATAPDYTLLATWQGAVGPTFTDVMSAAEGVEGGPPPVVDTSPGATAPAHKEWPNLVMSPGGNGQGGAVDLDAVYADAVANRLVLFTASPMSGTGTTLTNLGRITGASELSRSEFGLSAKVTRVVVAGIDLTDSGYRKKVRETAIYIETARETLLVVDADIPLPGSPRDRITIQGAVSLPAGRRIVLSGEQWTGAPGKGPQIGEVATLKSSTVSGGNTELVFERLIGSTFRSTSLKLLANAVRASHGETPASGPELLGSANAATPSPRFPLKRSPLTYVPSAGPRGYAPAIEVRVGDRRYEERPTLFGLGSEDRAFTVRTGREGAAVVQFAGRLPTGVFNVSATYRTGGGKAGNLGPGRLTTLMTPILGVGKVTNPVPAEGGSDAETIEELRTAAPQSMRTLDRLVSLADFEAFALTRPGIGKALATELHIGMRSVVCLTIATTELKPPIANSEVVLNLQKAIADVAVPGRSIQIKGFTDLPAKLTVALAIDPAFRRTDVEAAARLALGRVFGRAGRAFGESLHRSAVLAVLQAVEGVVAARLTKFFVPGGPPAEKGRLACPTAAMVGGTFVQAGLLSIDPGDIQFEEMQA